MGNRAPYAGPTPQQRIFIENYKGNATEAAEIAGFKHPRAAGSRLLKNLNIQAAIEAKKHRMELAAKEVEKEQIEKVTITRNDIINGLAGLARGAESEAVRATAYLGLADIFLLRVKNVRDINKFHGWTADELEEYARTGAIPERFRSVLGSSVSPAVSLRTEKV